MDRDEIQKRVKYIEDKLKWLKKSLDKYENSNKGSDERYFALKSVERDCEEIVESAIRINQEILSIKGDIGETYRDSFKKLEKLKIFDNKDFLIKLANTTGFRNRLAHDYIDLDEDLTIKSAKGILDIYPKYLISILDYLRNVEK